MENFNEQIGLDDQFKTYSFLTSKLIEQYLIEYAIKSDLFNMLENEFLTIEEIKSKIKFVCPNRNFQDCLDKLCTSKYLERQGSVDLPKYKCLNPIFLKSNPNNICNFFLWNTGTFRKITSISKYINEPREPNVFNKIYSDLNITYNFLTTMITLQSGNFTSISSNFDFKDYKTVCDVGGALGGFSVILKKKHPELECTTFDLPIIESIVKKYLKEHEMLDQVKIVSGDMFKDDLPKSDVISMGNILHDWDNEEKIFLFKKVYNGLNENGIFIIVEDLIDNERKESSWGLDMSILMIIGCGGFNMSFSDIEKYSINAGFKRVENMSQDIGGNCVVCFK